MEPEYIAVLMGLSFFFLLFIGFPVAIALAVSGLLFGYFGFGMGLFNLLPQRIFGLMENYTLLAIPLFVFIGVMLERSRLAEELLDVIGHAAGGLRGGMGLAIIFVGVLMGASTGIVGATVVTLGLLTLPVFVRRNYNKGLACGTICSSAMLTPQPTGTSKKVWKASTPNSSASSRMAGSWWRLCWVTVVLICVEMPTARTARSPRKAPSKLPRIPRKRS